MSVRCGCGQRIAFTMATIVLFASTAHAQVNYVGHDAVFSPQAPRPNCNAAQANWTTAASGLGAVNIINFENPPVPPPGQTTYTTLNLGQGVTLTANVATQPFTIANNGNPLPEDAANGFNVTPAGAIRCSLVNQPHNASISYTFSFATPIQAFSLYATGEGNTMPQATLSLNYNDPAPQSTPMPSTIGARFAGFTDAGQSINSVTFTFGVGTNGFVQSFISLDDIRWVHIGQPPVCAPNAAGTGCTSTCPPGMICIPTEITVQPGGDPRVTKCECVSSDTVCHIGLTGTNDIVCEGSCPVPGEVCSTKVIAWPDGRLTYSCVCGPDGGGPSCEPITQCNPDMPGSCMKTCMGRCPTGDEICYPNQITVPSGGGLASITDCDCEPEGSNPCRPYIDAVGGVSCIGQCPNNEPCIKYSIDNPDGSVTHGCCCPSIHGACCITSSGGTTTCVIIHECECATAGGTYFGNGSTCTPNPCVAEPELGACCNVQGGGPGGPSGTCTITSAADCVPPDVWLGPGSNCGPPNPCLPTGACCINNPFTGGTCIVADPQTCHDQGGMFMGPSVPCTPSPCPNPIPAGACCVNDDAGQGVCVIVTAVECDSLGGHYYGNASSCTPTPTGPPQCSIPDECQCENPCYDRAPNYNDTAYASFTGEVAAVTTYSPAGSGDPVVQIVDVKNRATAPLNTDWAAATRFAKPTWTADPTGVGSVFGVTVDKRGHVYVTSTTCYNLDDIGLSGGLGTVYKIANGTGAISVFANLPNSGGTGLGNIDYDGVRDQFFVTNMEDGRIYRINSAGVVLSTFDHATNAIAAGGGAEPGDVAGYVPLGERIWGVGTYQGRVYYSVWAEDMGRPSTTLVNTIRSVALNGSGDFTGVSQLDITLPPRPFVSLGAFYSNPVADISFSRTTCMLVSERTMQSDTYPSAHDSRVFEYKKVGGAWWPSGYTYAIGIGGGVNAAGGNDFDSVGRIYATGDYLQAFPQTIYGFQSLPCTGGSVANSALRDMNGTFTFADKMEIGDIEIACSSPCAKPPSGMTVWFPFDETTGIFADNIAGNPNGTYTNGPISVAGTVNAARNFNGLNQYVDAPSASNISFGTGNFSVDAWIQMADGAPRVFVDKRVTPVRGFALGTTSGQLSFVLADGTASTFTFPGGPGFVGDGNWHHVAVSVTRNSVTGLVLYVDGVASTAFDPTPRSGSISNTAPLRVGGPCPGFSAATHFRGNIDEVEIFNRALTAAEVQAIYNAGKSGKCRDGAQAALLTYCINQSVLSPIQTICNYGSASQTYNWSLSGPLTGPGCTLLSPITFTPASGTVSVGPGSCVSVPPINSSILRPVGLVPGQTSCYQLSATNTTTGNTVTSQGTLGAINKKCFTHGGTIGVIDHILVPIGIGKSISWLVNNVDDPNPNTEYKIQVQADGDPDQQAVSLNGLPPGTRYIGNLTIPPGGSGTIPVDVSALLHEPFDFYQIILFLDVDGDGILEPVDAIEMRTYAGCGARQAGDVDGDGQVNSGDITAFVNVLLSGLFDPLSPDPWCAADITQDAAVDGRDVRPFTQMVIGP